ncbi:MAG: protein translocase subunit SecD [Thermodesulfobacteriota bacterium]
MKNFPWKQVLTAIVLLCAVVMVLPSINPEVWPHKKINLGLDLQGGMHLILEVQTEKAVEGQIGGLAEELKNAIREERIKYTDISAQGSRIVTTARSRESIDALNALVKKQFGDLKVAASTENDNIQEMSLILPEKQIEDIKKMSVDQALETIRNRIDEFGVSEPTIHIQGKDRILIQLPGVTDAGRAKSLIGKTALLEFRLVDEEHDVSKALQGNTPAGSEVLYQINRDPETGQTTRVPYLIKKGTPLTGVDLADAQVRIDGRYNESYVALDFNRKGAIIFDKITGENVKKRLAIVLDNNVYSAPVINERISGGSAQITGSFTDQEAHDLAIVLRAGALPAPVTILEERTVGPSLGRDSIRKGLFSMAVGGILVFVFMVIYYKSAGLIAVAALLADILLIAAGLAAFGATLTLPGIAGIILTIGMAVDGNILIYERIREELRVGKTSHSAVSTGFIKASLTIIDANITTLIAALVLFQFGTGPIKGFAVTLSLGVVATVFTSVVLSRLIFEYLLINRKMKSVSI